MTTNTVTNTKKKFKSDYSQQKFKSALIPHLKVEFENYKLKLLIISFVILFNGLSAVLTQVYLSDILKFSGIQVVNPPTPSLMSLLAKFFGDSSIYIIMLILIGMGSFSNELEINKPVYFTLSRPISRRTYYFSRTILQVVGNAFVTALTSLIIYFYSLIYFDPLSLDKILLALFVLSLQYASFYAIMIMFSTKFSPSIAGVLGFLTYIFMILMSISDAFKWFSPLSLSGMWTKIVTTSVSTSDFFTTILALLAWIMVPILIGWIIYKRRDI